MAPTRRALLWLLVAVLGLLWNLPFLLQAGGLDDEAVATLGAQRVLEGQLPYRDFDTRHTPGSYFTVALGFALLGHDVLATRVLMLLNASLLGLAVFAIAARLQGEKRALVPWLLFSWTGVTQWPILSYHWIALLAWLLGILALLHRRWGLAGAATALAAWYLQSEGAALVATTVLALALERGAWRRALAAFALTSLALWGPLLLFVSPREIWHENVEAMRWHVPFNHAPFTLRYLEQPAQDVWAGLHKPWTWGWLAQSLSNLGVWIFKYGLYFPLLLAMLGLGLRRPGPLRLLAAAQLILTLALWNRQDMLYLNYLTPLFYVLFCALWPWRPLAAGLLALFGAQYLFWCLDSRNYVYPIDTPNGMLYSNSPQEAQTLTQIFRSVRQFSPPGTPTFAYPYAPSFYTLSQTRDATRFAVLVPLLYPRSDAELARQELTVPLVYRCPAPGVADYPSVSPEQFESEMQAFDRILLQDYELAGRVGFVEIYRRKR